MQCDRGFGFGVLLALALPAAGCARLDTFMNGSPQKPFPVLLRVESEGGLEATRAQREADAADEQAFLLWQMGEPDDQPPPP